MFSLFHNLVFKSHPTIFPPLHAVNMNYDVLPVVTENEDILQYMILATADVILHVLTVERLRITYF